MQIFSHGVTIVYFISQILAGCGGILVFILIYRSLEGRAGLGFGILAGLLSTAPLFLYDSYYRHYPTLSLTFYKWLWITFLLKVIASMIYLFTQRKKLRSFELLGTGIALIFIGAPVGASWTAKTVETIVQVFGNSEIPKLWQIICGVFGGMYAIFYFIAPQLIYFFLIESLGDYKKKKKRRALATLDQDQYTVIEK